MLKMYYETRRFIKPLRYLFIMIHLLYLRLKRMMLSEWRRPELFLLKCLFTYYLWWILQYLSPHIEDISKMELSWTDQLDLWLINAGFITPPIEDLNALSGYNIVIAGMVKDAQRTLPTLINQLEIFSCAFDSAHIIILESNSADHTRDIIKHWTLHPPDCESIHESLLHSLPNRLKQKIKHRNDFQKVNDRNYSGHHSVFGDHRIFHKTGKVTIESIQPSQEFEEIAALKQKHETEGYGEVREERYVIYRNILLDKVTSYYKSSISDESSQRPIDYLVWVDMDLRGFDIQGIASEFSYAWRAGFDVVCTNGIKYSGWYYDSYASVYEDGGWAYGEERWKITNRIRGERFYEMRSCFGGFAAYHLPFLVDTKCRYRHFGWAQGRIQSFKEFSDAYRIERACEHLPFNFCIREHGGKLAVASEAHSFYVELHFYR